ncbi:MAG: hypothetical protein KF898_07825 [Parachlamydiales bacterium]|nr:hypothetical protein [Candidatus Acheromyda pituitae]
MPTKITVFFRLRTFTLKSTFPNNPETDGNSCKNNAELHIAAIHHTALNRLARLQKNQVSLAVNDYEKKDDPARYEVLSFKRSVFPCQELDFRWKKRETRILKIRNWRKR